MTSRCGGGWSAAFPGASVVRLMQQKRGCEYKFYTEFQSHEPEFDYLKSLEIEEKINRIKWCKRQNSAHFLLSTNGMFFAAMPWTGGDGRVEGAFIGWNVAGLVELGARD